MNWQHFVDLIHREMASGIVGVRSPGCFLRRFWRVNRPERESSTALPACGPTCSSVSVRRCLRFFSRPCRRTLGLPVLRRRLFPYRFHRCRIYPAYPRLTIGLTTAATIFVVASVGMAAGGGLYLTAFFATALVLGSLFFLGYAEENFNIKLLLSNYEVTGASVEEISQEVNRILETHHRMMQNMTSGNTGQHVRVQFVVEGCNSEQKELLRLLKASKVLQSAVSLGRVEHE